MRESDELHEALASVARDLLATVGPEPDPQRIVDAGWLSMEVPEALGGAGATFAEVAVVLEELGRATATAPVLATAVLGVGALAATMPSPGRERLLADVAEGRVRLAVALAPSGESATASPAFDLVRAPDGLRLTGSAAAVLDATVADRFLLLADAGGTEVLVELAAAGTAVVEEPVLDATRSLGRVQADSVTVAADAVLALPPGAAQHVLERGALGLACDSIGVAAAMLDATVRYVSDRHQFGRPVGSFQAVKHACADMAVSLATSRSLVSVALDALVTGSGGATAAVARAKAQATASAVDIVGTALQLHGGIGYTWESGIHVHLKRALLNRSLLGSPRAHRLLLFHALGLVAPDGTPPGTGG